MTQPLAAARRDLQTPPGVPGSGRLRYAAAMDLWRSGEMTPEALEVYRICATLDAEDPLLLLAARGAAPPGAAPPLPPTAALAALAGALDRCLAASNGPGVAEARAGLARARPAAPPPPRPHPVVSRHLPAALAQVDGELARAIGDAAPSLAWTSYDLYAPGSIGDGFAGGHAYATLVGEASPYTADDFDLGLFLIAPHVLYRDHRHAAPELYLPLTGPHGWRFGPGSKLVVKPALEPVWNDPFAPHLTKVGSVPFLCVYAWTRDTEKPAEVVPAHDWPALEALRL